MTRSNDHDATKGDVAVLGCGNMGSSMVRVLLQAGWRVTAWNRTIARAKALEPDGATVVESAREALTAAPFTILCVGTTEDSRALLERVEEGATHDGRTITIINTTSGTPDDAHELRPIAQARNFDYVDASISAYPDQLGTEEARLLVSGDEQLWNRVEVLIRDLAGGSRHVGDDIGAANALDCAMVGSFYISALTAYLEAVQFAQKFGVSLDTIEELSSRSVDVLGGEIATMLGRMRAKKFDTDQATLAVYATAASTMAAGLRTKGRAPIIEATAQRLQGGLEAGLGDLDIAAIVTHDHAT